MSARYLLTCAGGLEDLVEEEIKAAGGTVDGRHPGRLWCQLEPAQSYHLLLWTRVASRLYKLLEQFPVTDIDALYRSINDMSWELWFRPGMTLAVQFDGELRGVRNSMFGAQRIKDAVVDRCRDHQGWRPDVDTEKADVRLLVQVDKGEALVFADCGGLSLHQRGYRQGQGAAPLKENLAAALLLRSRWQGDVPLLDPFCGSGTIVIEAALMAADIAPGLLRREPTLVNFPDFSADIWQQIVGDAEQRRSRGLQSLSIPIAGSDNNPRLVQVAKANARSAGVGDICQFETVDATTVTNTFGEKGHIITNPPYGVRLGDMPGTLALYYQFARNVKLHFGGWNLSVFSSDEGALEQLKMRPERRHQLYNGPLRCRLMHYAVTGGSHTEAAPDFANRVRKNLKKIVPWAEQEGVNAFRIYDADLPEYNLAIDHYDEWLVVQEYAAPSTVDETLARRRRDDALVVLGELHDPQRIAFKTRQRQRGTAQYDRMEEQGIWLTVAEYSARFRINPTDYLDTGLFLDHRPMRRWLRDESRNKRVLNLFCYTATATVQAALGGAKETLSVDLSNTYLDWAEENFRLNRLDPRKHRLLRGDCLTILDKPRGRFDRVFLDPPTFSNSKKMDAVFDVQRDYLPILDKLRGWLEAGAIVMFSTNHTRFKLDSAAVEALGYRVEDASAKSIPVDFARNPKIHRAWFLHWQREKGRVEC